MRGIYKHYKGNDYEVIGVAKDEAKKIEYVVYKQLYGDYALWIRPLSMFTEIITHEGNAIKRFEKTAEAEPTQAPKLPNQMVTHSETGDQYKIYYSTYGDMLVRREGNTYRTDEMADFESPDMWEKEERVGSWGNIGR